MASITRNTGSVLERRSARGGLSSAAVSRGLPRTEHPYEAGRRYGHLACRRLGRMSTGLFLDRPMC
jgi:hypothetical protein